jgi:hypothetical protein
MSETVKYSKRFYYCEECKVEHEYRDALFDGHRMFASDYGRWVYEEVDN